VMYIFIGGWWSGWCRRLRCRGRLLQMTRLVIPSPLRHSVQWQRWRSTRRRR
jgi:hypothetical protein